MYNTIYKQVEEYVTDLFDKTKKKTLYFHSLEHTEKIVQRAQEIGAHYKLSEKETLAIYIAAWFHDTGHLFSEALGHEERGVEIMKNFMEKHSPDADLIRIVENCILATKRDKEPTTLLEQIVCDADTYHLGNKEFKKTNKQVRKEVSTFLKEPMAKMDWDIKTLEFLEKHKYYTSYCQELLNAGKQENIERLRQKIVDSTMPTEESKLFGHSQEKDDPKADKQKISLLSRGIQTVMRLASENHLRLSDMADGKANILISVNAIIISVILSVLLRKFETDPYLIIPTTIFLAFSVTTIVISILATRPKVTKGQFSKEDILNKKVNLLFFGNFYKASLEDYNWGMTMMMRDPDYLYGSLIKDVYYLGVVLGRKYKLLRIAYNVFMVGIIVSVLAFTIAVFTHTSSSTTIVTSPTSSPF